MYIHIDSTLAEICICLYINDLNVPKLNINSEANAEGPCNTTPLTQLPTVAPVTMVLNGVTYPLGPPVSTFKGFLGDLNVYGYANVCNKH